MPGGFNQSLVPVGSSITQMTMQQAKDQQQGFGQTPAPSVSAPADQSQINAVAAKTGGTQTVQQNSDKFAINSMAPQPLMKIQQQTPAQTSQTASQIAQTAQGGAVNSATAAARAAGLSPAMAAMVGANAGSSTYQSVFPQAYGTAGQLGLGEQGLQQSWNLGQQNVGLGEQGLQQAWNLGQAGINVQQQQVGVQQAQQQAGFWGGLLSGLGGLAIGLAPIGLEKGTDSAQRPRYASGTDFSGSDMSGPIGTPTVSTSGRSPLIQALGKIGKGLTGGGSSLQSQGSDAASQAASQSWEGAQNVVNNALQQMSAIGKYEKGTDGVEALVGENGPERVILPEGSMVIPNIKDGYDMLKWVVKKAARGQDAQTPRGVSIGKDNVQAATLSMIDALNDKIDRMMKYVGTRR